MTIDIAGRTALVTGASRGFGRAITVALGAAGARVVGVARDQAPLEDLRTELGGSFTPVAADAADPVAAGQLIDAYRPDLLVLNAGAAPLSLADPAAHLADVQPELGRRRPARLRMDA